MLSFLWDFVKFPWDKNNPNNKFGLFLKTVFRDYPAFLWTKPTWQRFLLAPLLMFYSIFRAKKKK